MDLFLIMDARTDKVTGWRFDLKEAQAAAYAESGEWRAGYWEQAQGDENRWVNYTGETSPEGFCLSSRMEVHRMEGPGEPPKAPLAPSGSLVMEMTVTTPGGARASLSRTVLEERLPYLRAAVLDFGTSASGSLADQIERLTS